MKSRFLYFIPSMWIWLFAVPFCSAFDARIAVNALLPPSPGTRWARNVRGAETLKGPQRLSSGRVFGKAMLLRIKGAQQSEDTGFRSGFVSIIGNPNVGKSTLLNRILDQNLCICSPKPQTTRHRILGVKTSNNHQIVFSDTPGAIPEPAYALQDAMMKSTYKALTDCDLILLMSDVFAEPLYDQKLLKRIVGSSIPKLIVVNKADLFKDNRFDWKLDAPEKTKTSNTSSPQLIDEIMQFKEFVSGGEATRTSGYTTREGIVSDWRSVLPDAEVMFVSARTGHGVAELERNIASKLPIGPKYYPDDVITDRSERFFAAEIIREALLYRYKREVPYHCDVQIVSFEDRDGAEGSGLTVIHAEILVTRESQKAILLGHKGSAIREASSRAQIQLEKFLDRRVQLSLNVKVNAGWRNSQSDLMRSGYLE